jgi:hypothetical protein
MSSLDLTHMVQVRWPRGHVTYSSITKARELLRRPDCMNGSVWLKELDRQIAEAEAGLCYKQR